MQYLLFRLMRMGKGLKDSQSMELKTDMANWSTKMEPTIKGISKIIKWQAKEYYTIVQASQPTMDFGVMDFSKEKES